MPPLKINVQRVFVTVDGDPEANDAAASELALGFDAIGSALGAESMEWKRSTAPGQRRQWMGYVCSPGCTHGRRKKA